MKIMKAIKEINQCTKDLQFQINKRDESNLSDYKIMELMGKRDGLQLAMEIIKENW